MVANTLARYFAGRFIGAAVAVFFGVFMLVVLVDYIEMTRKTSGTNASTWLIVQTSLFRVPQLLERLTPKELGDLDRAYRRWSPTDLRSDLGALGQDGQALIARFSPTIAQ